MSEPLCSIVIPTYRHGDMLHECLRSIAASVGSDGTSHEVVVVVNGPQFAWFSGLVETLRGVTLVQSAINRGFSGGCNLGVGHSRGKYVVLLNDDATVEPGWLRALVDTVERAPADVAAVGSCNLTVDGVLDEAGSVIFADGSTMAAGRGMPAESTEWDFVRDVDYCSASSLLIKRDAWDAVGGFDIRYHPAYHEDTDLCLRLRDHGYRILYEPRSRIVHRVSQSTEVGFRELLMRRNRGVVAVRWAARLREHERPPKNGKDIRRAVERGAQRARRVRRQVLLVDDLLPSTGVGAGFSRTIQLVQDVTGARDALTVAALAAAPRTSDLLRDFGVRVVEQDLLTYLSRPEIVVDAAVISRPNNVPLCLDVIRRTQPHAAVVMDHEALFHRRLRRQAAMATDPEEAARLAATADYMQLLVDRAVAAVDLNVCISEEEAAYVRGVQGSAPVRVLEPRAPLTVPTAATLDGRRDLVFVAGWMAGPSSPNVDAIVWFVERVLPLVRSQVPWARVRVTGATPPPQVRALAADGVKVCGYVDDLGAAYAGARAVIAPIRVGAGVKLKTVEALEYGVPTVATTVGAEGIDLGDHTNALVVTDEESAFAAAVVELLVDGSAWRRQRAAIDGLLGTWAKRPTGSWADILDAALTSRREGHPQEGPATIISPIRDAARPADQKSR